MRRGFNYIYELQLTTSTRKFHYCSIIPYEKCLLKNKLKQIFEYKYAY